MKYTEFVKELKKAGCEFSTKGGKGSHIKVANPANGKKTTMPFHKGKEIKNNTMKGIKKQLGL